MDKETKQEFDNLAIMIQKGFEQTIEKKNFSDFVTRTEESFRIIDNRFNQVNARLDNIERDISEIRKHFVYRDEFEDLMARVKYLETKLGIESGK